MRLFWPAVRTSYPLPRRQLHEELTYALSLQCLMDRQSTNFHRRECSQQILVAQAQLAFFKGRQLDAIVRQRDVANQPLKTIMEDQTCRAEMVIVQIFRTMF